MKMNLKHINADRGEPCKDTGRINSANGKRLQKECRFLFLPEFFTFHWHLHGDES